LAANNDEELKNDEDSDIDKDDPDSFAEATDP
jgi:hypothetical protein